MESKFRITFESLLGKGLALRDDTRNEVLFDSLRAIVEEVSLAQLAQWRVDMYIERALASPEAQLIACGLKVVAILALKRQSGPLGQHEHPVEKQTVGQLFPSGFHYLSHSSLLPALLSTLRQRQLPNNHPKENDNDGGLDGPSGGDSSCNSRIDIDPLSSDGTARTPPVVRCAGLYAIECIAQACRDVKVSRAADPSRVGSSILGWLLQIDALSLCASHIDAESHFVTRSATQTCSVIVLAYTASMTPSPRRSRKRKRCTTRDGDDDRDSGRDGGDGVGSDDHDCANGGIGERTHETSGDDIDTTNPGTITGLSSTHTGRRNACIDGARSPDDATLTSTLASFVTLLLSILGRSDNDHHQHKRTIGSGLGSLGGGVSAAIGTTFNSVVSKAEVLGLMCSLVQASGIVVSDGGCGGDGDGEDGGTDTGNDGDDGGDGGAGWRVGKWLARSNLVPTSLAQLHHPSSIVRSRVRALVRACSTSQFHRHIYMHRSKIAQSHTRAAIGEDESLDAFLEMVQECCGTTGDTPPSDAGHMTEATVLCCCVPQTKRGRAWLCNKIASFLSRAVDLERRAAVRDGSCSSAGVRAGAGDNSDDGDSALLDVDERRTISLDLVSDVVINVLLKGYHIIDDDDDDGGGGGGGSGGDSGGSSGLIPPQHLASSLIAACVAYLCYRIEADAFVPPSPLPTLVTASAPVERDGGDDATTPRRATTRHATKEYARCLRLLSELVVCARLCHSRPCTVEDDGTEDAHNGDLVHGVGAKLAREDWVPLVLGHLSSFLHLMCCEEPADAFSVALECTNNLLCGAGGGGGGDKDIDGNNSRSGGEGNHRELFDLRESDCEFMRNELQRCLRRATFHPSWALRECVPSFVTNALGKGISLSSATSRGLAGKSVARRIGMVALSGVAPLCMHLLQDDEAYVRVAALKALGRMAIHARFWSEMDTAAESARHVVDDNGGGESGSSEGGSHGGGGVCGIGNDDNNGCEAVIKAVLDALTQDTSELCRCAAADVLIAWSSSADRDGDRDGASEVGGDGQPSADSGGIDLKLLLFMSDEAQCSGKVMQSACVSEPDAEVRCNAIRFLARFLEGGSHRALRLKLFSAMSGDRILLEAVNDSSRVCRQAAMSRLILFRDAVAAAPTTGSHPILHDFDGDDDDDGVRLRAYFSALYARIVADLPDLDERLKRCDVVNMYGVSVECFIDSSGDAEGGEKEGIDGGDSDDDSDDDDVVDMDCY